MSNLRVEGIQTLDGGIYDEVRIEGCLKCNGNIECNSLRIEGLSTFRGDVITKGIKIEGKTTVEGNLTGSDIEVEGLTTVKGNLKGDNIRVEGKLRVDKSLEAENINLEGLLTVKGDCTVENFKSEGKPDIKGLLNAGTIEIDIATRCYIKEIGGDKVTIRQSGGMLNVITSLIVGKTLISDVIEADEIYLENTRADVVRGNKVIIGKNCSIRNVEYKESFEVKENGCVENSSIVE